MTDYTINVGGRLMDLSHPKVMGILNVTPDSFYADSRSADEATITAHLQTLITEGADIIDIGGCSTRPGADIVDADEECRRLKDGLRILRQLAPEVVVSVDTFRSDVARMCIDDFGVEIVNDVSGGADPAMFALVAEKGVPYVLTHHPDAEERYGFPTTTHFQYDGKAKGCDDLMDAVMLFFAERVQRLCDLGQKDIIIDPGFGFCKTLEQNYELLDHLEELKLFNLPILIGVSRKSMIYKRQGCTPTEALEGTTAIHHDLIQRGCANILRVHDVKAAKEILNS